MNKKIAFIFISIMFLMLNRYALYAQIDTLNRINSQGKKQGYWVKYLDEKFNSVGNISNACYFLFEFYYSNGKSKSNPFNYSKMFLKKMPINVCREGNPVGLTGVYTFVDKINNGATDDTLHLVETKYENGQLLYLKEKFYVPEYKTPRLLLWGHHDVRYNNIPGTYMSEAYLTNSKKGFFLDSRSFYYQENGHWRYHKIKDEKK